MEKWSIYNRTGDFERIVRECGVSYVAARLLVNRGVSDPEAIKRFLNPSFADLHSPHLMKNLDEAVGLIRAKISEGKRLRIVGDYDVDGIMSTYILSDALSRLEAKVDWYIPHRIRDGYGLNVNIIKAAYADGVDTIITCDNGISAVDAAYAARELGMTLIITDHHELPDQLPGAAVIVDPKQEGDTYPCREICGAVVAAKVVQALLESFGIATQLSEYIDCMAMATICDVVSLQGENRVIAKLGMERFKCTSNLGLASLMAETGSDVEHINEYHLGFVLGPCLNATGRIDDAGLAMELLEAKSVAVAQEIAMQCKALNEDRKGMTLEQERIAAELLDEMGEDIPRVIVLELPECHESILGIIAGRIKEKYNRPAIIVTKSGDNYKGSGRSIPAYSMFEELNACNTYLLKYGGHPMAAGLTIAGGHLEDFRRELNEHCRLSADDMYQKILIDAQASFNMFSELVVKEIESLAPFGQGNPSPLFAEKDLKVKNIRYMGRDNNFLRMRLMNSFGYEFSATCFLDAQEVIGNLTDAYGANEVQKALNGLENRMKLTIAYVPRINEYRDNVEIQMNIKAIKTN